MFRQLVLNLLSYYILTFSLLFVGYIFIRWAFIRWVSYIKPIYIFLFLSEEFKDEERVVIQDIRRKIIEAVKSFFLINVLAFLGACFFIVVSPNLNEFIPLFVQIVGICFIILALIGKMGWDIKIFKVKTLPLKVNHAWFMLLSVAGSFLLLIASFYVILLNCN